MQVVFRGQSAYNRKSFAAKPWPMAQRVECPIPRRRCRPKVCGVPAPAHPPRSKPRQAGRASCRLAFLSQPDSYEHTAAQMTSCREVKPMLAPAQSSKRRFQLVLIKPSHYDDDGYVIQWWRSFMPSNSLAVVYGLADDAARRQVLGPDVAIGITACDETNTRGRFKDLMAQVERHDGFGLVGLVGVQSNQFPRTLDIARPLRAAGIPVVIGGFHISGCLAMLPEMPPELLAALDMGCSLFAGEAEDGRLDRVLQD